MHYQTNNNNGAIQEAIIPIVFYSNQAITGYNQANQAKYPANTTNGKAGWP